MVKSKLELLVPASPDMRVRRFWSAQKRETYEALWAPHDLLAPLDINLEGMTNLVLHEDTTQFPVTLDGVTSIEADYASMVEQGNLKASINHVKRSQGEPAVGRSTSLSHPVTCTKIRIYPNSHQKPILSEWFGAARFVYDRCLDEFVWSGDLSLTNLRDNSIRALAEDESHTFLKAIPDKVKAGAVADFVNAVKSNRAKQRLRPSHTFEMKYRAKKDKLQTILIPKDACDQKLCFFKRTLGPVMTWRDRSSKIGEELCFPVGSDSRLSVDAAGRYHLHVVTGMEDRTTRRCMTRGDSQASVRMGVVGLDPGVKTFQTFYSPGGMCGKIGKGLDKRIGKLRKHLNDLNARCKAEKSNTRRARMKKASARMRLKIRNIVDELHWKAASFLCDTFSIILIPIFRVQPMVQGHLNRATKQSMHDLRHYTFRTRLLHKARESNTKVVVCSEAYTTKTCSSCGKLSNIGNNDVFTCSGRLGCGLVADRDLHGARNVVLRNTYTIGSSPFCP
jgi:putative transposase